MKRLLCILSGMNAGGAETFLMKIYRALDRSKYQMDFCINVKEKCFYEDEILEMGGRIYRISSKSENLKAFKNGLANIVKDNAYDYVMRITSSTMGFMDLMIAKKSGATVCCARSSNASDGGSFKSKIVHILGRILYRKYVDVAIAPSDLAAIYTFGRESYENGTVHILHNAVDLDIFKYSEMNRAVVRNELGISEEKVVIGHIGRFNEQKNHRFLIEVFAEISKQYNNAMLLLVGTGNLQDAVKQQVNDSGLSDKVVFAGVRTDIPAVLSAMDVFVMPSFYEGMPNTVIEAQATGLPCVIANTITTEANITGLVEYLPLGDRTEWATTTLKAISSKRVDTKKFFFKNKYDIKSATEQFVELIFNDKG